MSDRQRGETRSGRRAGARRTAGAPGRMTAVMRAVARPQGSQHLRVGVVQAGRMVDERVFERQCDVTIGCSENDTFLLAELPSATLLSADGSGYRLRVHRGMSARVADGGSAVEVRAGTELVLSQRARGKVVVGDTTLLFQFVEPPPKVAHAQLPLAVSNPPLSRIDWTTTVVAAFSFLIHFFGVALVYSDFADPIVSDDYVALDLLDAVERLPAPPPLEQPRAEAESESTDDATAAPDPKSGAHTRSPRGPSRGAAREPRAGGADAKAAAIAEELAALDVQTIVGLGNGLATREVMDNSEVPASLLDDEAHAASGARHADPLRIGQRRGELPLPGSDRRLSEVGTTRQSDAAASATAAGSSEAPAGPTGGARVGTPQQGGAVVDNAQAVVARMRGPFRHCYQRGLGDHPTMEGSVTLIAKLGPGGQVMSVAGGGGPLGPIVACLKAVVRSGAFSPPRGGGGAVLGIPINFWLQR